MAPEVFRARQRRAKAEEARAAVQLQAAKRIKEQDKPLRKLRLRGKQSAPAYGPWPREEQAPSKVEDAEKEVECSPSKKRPADVDFVASIEVPEPEVVEEGPPTKLAKRVDAVLSVMGQPAPRKSRKSVRGGGM